MALSSERARVAHLLRRAGFGASEAELNEYAQLGFDGAVSRLVNYEAQPDLPETVAPEAVGLQVWWLEKMLHTRRPLQEKMTLFWHGHLTSALKEVPNPNAMLDQNRFLRANALGNFDALLRGISRDPAMMDYLDLRNNRKSAPNENYARELMELFTLGIGNYTEDDVREAARAFTGWSLTPDGRFAFNQNQHDYGPKTVLGQEGDFTGDDVTNLLAAQPATGRFISAKLFRFFAYTRPEPALIERLADIYVRNGRSIKAVVEGIFRSPEFVSEPAYRALIKSPTELLVGTLRALGADHVPVPTARVAMRLLGQELFNPPHVAGWFGGRGWINASTLLNRFNFAGSTASQVGSPQAGGRQLNTLLQGAAGPEARVQRVLDLLLDGDVTTEERAALLGLARQTQGAEQVGSLFRLAMALPAYQLN